jgi:site-specific DNA-cytosine methylase
VTSRPIAVGGDVFAGAFTYGIVQAGFDVNVHLEHVPYGVKTAKLNFPHLDIRIGVENWHPETLKKVDFLYSNPPCAPWSTLSAGRAHTWDKDPRLSCVETLMEAGLTMKVKAFAWESVTQAWGKGRSFVNEKAKLWMDRGYHVTVLIQNNLYLGAPQNRRRMFFIAHQHPLVWPKVVTKHPTIGELIKKVKVKSADHFKGNAATEGDVLLWHECPQHHHSFSRTYKALPVSKQKKIRCKPNWLAKRYRSDEVSHVFFPGSVWHPTEPRRFTYKEMLAICGLPQTWQIETDKFGPIGGLLSRTVLAPAGEWLGRAVLVGLTLPKLRGKPTYNLVKILSSEIERSLIS